MRYVSKLFMALCLALGLGAVAANAQIDSEMTVEANIPHSFVVRDRTLPAGSYTIKVADPNRDLNVLEIRSARGRAAVNFETEGVQPAQTPAKSELIFDKVGDTYFLSEVLVAGDDTGARLRESRMEERLEGKGQTAERHSVAAVAKPFRKLAKKL